MITVHFYLRFRSTYGQQFFISGNTEVLGNEQGSLAKAMQYLNEDTWHLQIELPNQSAILKYKYILRHADGSESMEWPMDRYLDLSTPNLEIVSIVDTWNYPGEYENVFSSQVFQKHLFANEKTYKRKSTPKQFTHTFRVKAPLLPANKTVFIAGTGKELGNWDTQKPILMQKETDGWYSASVDLAKAGFPLAYKYGVYDWVDGTLEQWENGNNRTLNGSSSAHQVIVHDGFVGLPNNTFRGAGVAVPVFSLRSNNGLGVGEFTDIKLLADWSNSVGMKLIQLLPVNDTSATNTWQDSYPYAAISAFALHPIYINLETVAGDAHNQLLAGIEVEKERLNHLDVVDYEAVMELKWRYLYKLYAAMKTEWLTDREYQTFFDTYAYWLKPYAAFCFFRNQNQTIDFNNWQAHSHYDPDKISELFDPASAQYDDLMVHLFVQWHLHLQLKDAVDYTHKKGLVVKGDIPIGIYRYSCDAWQEPELYNMDYQAGAPPDDFAVKGQNWGFPTYNWQKMQANGFQWWKQRFTQMSLYFDAFRIDHILGFFRIWSIPLDAVEGIMGHFVPALPVNVQEFSERGMWFDYDRLCKPYIPESLVYEWFGVKARDVIGLFLNNLGNHHYQLKADFDTQRKVESWFNDHAELDEWIKYKLLDLVSNFILIEEPGSNGQSFHFRISMYSTDSYHRLDADMRTKLMSLYNDYFFKRQNDFWRVQAMQKLPELKASTNMLICGEDLGMVPDCVPGVMKDLGFLSLEIQRMPKDPTTQFFHPADAPYLSVVTPSTHDMSTLREWWEEDAERTQRFFNEQLGYYGKAPFYCEPWIATALITQHVYSTAMWSIFQLQDLFAIDGELRRVDPHEERINVPANPKHYWRYRIHLTLEELMQQNAFNEHVHNLLVASGRYQPSSPTH